MKRRLNRKTQILTNVGKKRNEEEGGQIMNVTNGARGLDSTDQKKNEDSMYFLDQEMSILFEHVDGKMKNYSGSW